jgi:protein-tyrosine-phosphatase
MHLESKLNMLHEALIKTIYSGKLQTADILENRKDLMSNIASNIVRLKQVNTPLHLLFICTHNSRRSQFAQVWNHIACDILGLNDVLKIYSAGTEVTEVYVQTALALKKAGMNVQNESASAGAYSIGYSNEKSPIHLFSKRFDDASIPAENRVAIMTCGDAEENCPFIPGTLYRVSLPYEDPKKWDNHTSVENYYLMKSEEIAIEAFYLMQLIQKEIRN